jgi:hypothetical protein
MKPKVNEIQLNREYKFMYQGFVLTNQSDAYLFLDADDQRIYGILFEPNYIHKFGYPNDEALGSHELAKYGLKWYSLFEVQNSPWIKQLTEANRCHPRHRDSLYADFQHYILPMKDNTFEIITKKITEIALTEKELMQLMKTEIEQLKGQ